MNDEQKQELAEMLDGTMNDDLTIDDINADYTITDDRAIDDIMLDIEIDEIISDAMMAEHSDGQQTCIPVNVPASLWAGKTPQAIFDTLFEKGFAPEVIAYVFVKNECKITKTDAGRMFYREAIGKGIEQDPRTYQRKIDDLLKDAKVKYSFTFDE